jgi:hypothetical protein
MHERLAARRDTVMSARRDALLDSLEDLAGQLEFIGSRLDVDMLRKAACAYREARHAILAAQPNEADMLRLFRALNESAAEIGALLQRYGVTLGTAGPPAEPNISDDT